MRAQSAESLHADVHEIVNDVDGIDAPQKRLVDVAPSCFAARPSACESRTQGLESSSVSFLHANVQGFVSKSADLAFFI